MKINDLQTALSVAHDLEDYMRDRAIRELGGVRLRFPIWAEVVGREITDADRWGLLMRALANENGPEGKLLDELQRQAADDELESVDAFVKLVDTAILRLAQA